MQPTQPPKSESPNPSNPNPTNIGGRPEAGTRRKVKISELQVGMYVCALDRPWEHTDYSPPGMRLESQEEIRELARQCQYVYIDVTKSGQQLYPSLQQEVQPTRLRPESGRKFLTPNISKIALDPLHRYHDMADTPRRDYTDGASWQQELVDAKAAMQAVNLAVSEMVDALQRGMGFRLAELKRALALMVASMVRNPDACMWLCCLKKEGEYLHQHSTATAVWAVALGRELGLPQANLKSLALGGVLLDIGKCKLPKHLLEKAAPLTEEELLKIHDHVKLSLEELALLEAPLGINQHVRDMVAAHHERHNGLGYPQGLQGGAIPLFARIAAIADCYDAMTSERPYADSLSPYQALKKLYQWRDEDFQAELIEEFIQALGIYPAGSLVELNSGEVAVVVAEGRERRLRPRVLMLLDKHKAPAEPFRTRDLSLNESTDRDELLRIASSLPPGAYGINSDFIQQASRQLM